MHLFVVGGLSYIGRSLIPELLVHGHSVAYSCRSETRPAPWPESDAQRFCVDLSRNQGWDSALAGVDVAFYLAHGMSSSERLLQRERAMASLFAMYAKQAGVKRVIYLGSLTSASPDSKHIQARIATGAIFRDSGLAVTEVRSGIVIGPGSAAFEVMRDMAAHLPLMTVPKWGDMQSPPVAIANLVFYLRRLAELPESAGQHYDIAGPQWLSYIQLLELVAKAIQRKPWIIRLPFLPVWLATHWVQLITSVPTPLAKQLTMGLMERLQADPEPIRKLIPQQLLTPEQAIDSALQMETIIPRPKTWEHGVPAYRNFSPHHAYYAKSDSFAGNIAASAERVWQVLCGIGGDNGYFCGKPLWWTREQLDRLIGGKGHLHQRTDPLQLRVGERVDSWEILTAEPPHLLVMRFGMKAPGGGGMQFQIEPLGEQLCRLTIGIHWHPAGVWGLLYWFAMKPFHHWLLTNMVKSIRQQAESE